MPIASADRLSQLMIETGRLIRGRLHGAGGEACPLSSLQFATLSCVQESATPLLMKELAARLHVTPPSATPVIESLTAAGCLRRSADRRDRRAVRLALTPKGRRLLASARRAHLEKMRAITGVLSPEDRAALTGILERLSEKFRA
jgi:DNA-binding MarR family transcriptional regulator